MRRMWLMTAVVFAVAAVMPGCGTEEPARSTGPSAPVEETTSTSETTPTTMTPPADVAAAAVLDLSDMPQGYGWEVAEPEEPVESTSFEDLVADAIEEHVSDCMMRTQGADIQPLADGGASFVQSPHPDFPDVELHHDVLVFADEASAAAAAGAASAAVVAKCFEDAIAEFVGRARDLAAEVGEELAEPEYQIDAEESAYLPGPYGDESGVSSVVFQDGSSYQYFDIATVPVGSVLSVVFFSQPVTDQQHELLALVASKMGGHVPEAPDLGLDH